MKMSKENYDLFMKFVNETVENATDADMDLLFSGLMEIAKFAVKASKKNKKNA